jgi:toxin-antitoxin system PIN domain toxin
MSVALLDVNVLVALFDPSHPNHDDAHAWFVQQRKRGWATCPITVNGCVRVLSNPAYPSVEATPAGVMSHLRILCSSPDHQFWPDDVGILDQELFRPELVAGHRAITDVYLLGLALRNKGKLATFDRSIPLNAVAGADARHLELIGIS